MTLITNDGNTVSANDGNTATANGGNPVPSVQVPAGSVDPEICRAGDAVTALYIDGKDYTAHIVSINGRIITVNWSDGDPNHNQIDSKNVYKNGACCYVHHVCAAGQWTKAVGTKTTETECVDCGPGTWREFAPSSSTVVEDAAAVCKPHKICSVGHWTKAVGNATTDTKCKHCYPGMWREVAPRSSTLVENRPVQCKPHQVC